MFFAEPCFPVTDMIELLLDKMPTLVTIETLVSAFPDRDT